MSRRNAIRVIVHHCVDSRTYRKASHLSCIERRQNLRKRLHILEAGIEPQIVVLLPQNYRHSIVYIRQERIRSGGWLESSKTQSQSRPGLSIDPTPQ